MSVCLVTGSGGLIGSESARFFSEKGFDVIGVDNDMRRYFFGSGASTAWSVERLREGLPGYRHWDCDIRDLDAMERLFCRYGEAIRIIVHTAAQPSHDWAAREPFTDFSINATGTLNLLEMTRKHCPEAVFIFTSTNKVYGDTPNTLPLVELETRYEIAPSHPFFENGISEAMSIDSSKHSLFGASKAAADLMVQEYGRYFGMKSVCFRGGCLTGGNHSGAELHGFLSYLMKCAVTGTPYTVYGYKGKQVRDNIHSRDLVGMFWAYFNAPRPGEVYNAGGGRHANCSMREAVRMCEDISGNKMNITFTEENRNGDHIWWISDMGKFRSHYPQWRFEYDLPRILEEIHSQQVFQHRNGG